MAYNTTNSLRCQIKTPPLGWRKGLGRDQKLFVERSSVLTELAVCRTLGEGETARCDGAGVDSLFDLPDDECCLEREDVGGENDDFLFLELDETDQPFLGNGAWFLDANEGGFSLTGGQFRVYNQPFLGEMIPQKQIEMIKVWVHTDPPC